MPVAKHLSYARLWSRTESMRFAIAAASVLSRLVFETIASWMLMEALAGCIAYGNAAQPCAGARCATRFEQTPGGRSGWHTAIIAAAVLPLSKIREVCARHRTIAELRNVDDRSLSDIGISRADIAYPATHGARPE